MIGPKCAICGKQRKFHGPVHGHCPMGKRRKCPVTGEILYEEFHPTNKFTPREPSRGGASEGRKDRRVRREQKAQPCIACGRSDGNDPAHVRSWAISQCDADFNITSLCRTHHVEQSNRGWLHMAGKYPSVDKALAAKGWEFIVYEATGDWSMFNPLEVEFQRKRRAV